LHSFYYEKNKAKYCKTAQKRQKKNVLQTEIKSALQDVFLVRMTGLEPT
jgi:hypothetical protein